MANVIKFKRKNSLKGRFDKVMEPHFDALYAAARRMTMSPHDAEDLVQEVCIKALNRLDDLEQMAYPRAWLLRVMYHQFVDDTRRASRSPVDAAETGDESSHPDDLVAHDVPPEERTDRDQQIERVLRAMRCLDPDHCALVTMHDVEGIGIEEISELTGMPAGTIKSQLHRTRKKLGRLLKSSAIKRPQLRIVGSES